MYIYWINSHLYKAQKQAKLTTVFRDAYLRSESIKKARKYLQRRDAVTFRDKGRARMGLLAKFYFLT